MRISIIIPALNEVSCIAWAVQQAWATDPHEVIVVDGGSRDGTSTLAADRGAQVLRSRPGRARQQNCGAKHATGDVLLFLHADTWLDSSGVRQIDAVLDRPTVLGGAFKQRIESPQRVYRLWEWGNSFRARVAGLPYGDQGLFLRRETFAQLGGFPQVDLMEDLLLMRALRPIARPVLLAGPLFVSPRRWQQQGLVRQTVCNWMLLAAEQLGATPDRLARYYPPHEPGEG